MSEVEPLVVIYWLGSVK